MLLAPHRRPLLHPPAWLPRADLRVPVVYADFAMQRYFFRGCRYPDFASWRAALSGTLDGSSTRYYTNSAGLLVGTTGPRFDYDPSTLAARGLLLEGARTNLCLRSQEFGTTWVPNSVTVTSNTVTSPDGTTTADTITTTATGDTKVYQNITTAAATYTWSVWVKRGTANYVYISANTGGADNISWFNLTNGTAGTNASGNTSTIVAFSDGWYRISVTRTASSGTSYAIIGLSNADTVITVSNGVTAYVWGAQIEAGSFASSYIPTTSGSVTRAADSLVFTPISGWYAAPFSMFAKATPRNTLGNRYLAELAKNNSDRANFVRSTGGIIQMVTGGSAIVSDEVGNWSNNASGKISGRFVTNNVRMAFNGTLGTQDTSAALLDTPTGLYLGRYNNSAGNEWEGHIEQFALWAGIGASDSALQALTT